MVTVQSHGDIIDVPNPARPGEVTRMQNVVFIEEGRSGANKQLSDSSDILSQVVGAQVGLEQVRTHTQPVRIDQIARFPVGLQLQGVHINRELHSTPQMRNQADKDARLVNGRPTYFVTFFSRTPEEDRDFRISIDVLATVNPNQLFNSQIGATETRRSSADGSNERYVGPNESNFPGPQSFASARGGNPLGANQNTVANAGLEGNPGGNQNAGQQLQGAGAGAQTQNA
jgi:hypothetical protein